MKIRLKRVSDTTGSFIELARAVEACSNMNPTESINVAKRVIYSEGPIETVVNVSSDADIDDLRNACTNCGVEVAMEQD